MKFSISNASVMVIVKGDAHTVSKGNPNFKPLCEALLDGRFDDVPDLLTVEAVVLDWAYGEFTVDGTAISYQGDLLPTVFADRILKMVSRGEQPRPLMRGWERLEENPSWRSRNQLFDFLRRNPGIPFTEDGFLLFYKGVGHDFRDRHSRQFDNSPGNILEMKRNRVSDDPTKACHFGFHVGARSYAKSFSGNGQVIICKVDPADVVCVPDDSSQQKVRICKYEVLGVDNGKLLPDTTFDAAGEPPIDPNEPLVAAAATTTTATEIDPAMQSGIDEMDGFDAENDGAVAPPTPTHTDGSPLQPGETAPLPHDAPAAVTLPLTGTKWDYMNDLDSLALLGEGIDPLRRYARNNCLIVGASKKVKGGKPGLVAAIVQARGYADPQTDQDADDDEDSE
jgi:hypothetical protein